MRQEKKAISYIMYPNTKVKNNVYNTEESLLLHYTKLYEIWYDEENKERKSYITLTIQYITGLCGILYMQ